MFRFERLYEDLEIRHREVNIRTNYSLMSNTVENFRLTGAQIEYVLSKIGANLQHPSRRNNCLSPLQQLLTTLHWLGNGAQYHGIAKMHGIHKSTVCRVVHRVSDAIIDVLMGETICWPENRQELALQFLNLGGFPRVAGCIDGTIINIDAPKINEEHYVNRHGDHALNVMMVCGPDRSFYAVNANWPGSVHDSRVLRNSQLFRNFEAGFRPFPGAVILGDSAYPLKEWLITPLRRNPGNPAEQRFNCAHKKTRRIVENSFGILKEKFPCLNHLRLEPKFAAKIVLVCCTLHNIAIKIRENAALSFELEDYYVEDVENIQEEREENEELNVNYIQQFVDYFS